jgi:hypothetical protein
MCCAPRRPDRDHHDAASLELLQQRRGNGVDAAGDDDPGEWAASCQPKQPSAFLLLIAWYSM